MSLVNEKATTSFQFVFNKIEALGSKKVMDFQGYDGFSLVDTFEGMGVKCAEVCSLKGSIKSIVSHGLKVTRDVHGGISFSQGTEDGLNELSETLLLSI